ncbi:nucleotide-diphospho-sugar transferase [Circinella umbellata]|nr:nucleotide-diphospho-sugar transferase [Circinella umbellata]
MAEATQVLVHSLVVNARTKHDIIVLVLPPVSQTVREQLKYLGAQIIEIEKINYPWKETEAAVKEGYNKACRYSKLHLWNLTKYRKVVFLDADTLVVQQIDELFQRPQFSGAIDAGGVVNTGVFVAQPSKEIFLDMLDIYEKAPSYNRGDQGFLNWYFNQSSVHVLPGYYNLMIKFMHFSNLVASHVYRNTVKIVHFTSEIKPWNFYYLHNREWRDNYDTYLFDKWIKTGRNMRSRLTQGNLLSASGSNNSTSKACNADLKSNYRSRYPKTNKFTIILSSSVQMDNPTWKTYIDSLLVLLTTNTDDINDIMVEKIFVVTKDGAFDDEELNENSQSGFSMPKQISGVPIEWISSSENAFSVVHRLKTEGALLLEDKVYTL